nr:MAG TPA: hypothetical protein [Caudoviricetes sp.]
MVSEIPYILQTILSYFRYTRWRIKIAIVI